MENVLKPRLRVLRINKIALQFEAFRLSAGLIFIGMFTLNPNYMTPKSI